MEENNAKKEAVSKETIEEVKAFLEKHKGEIIFKKKYFQAQKSRLRVETKALWKNSPHLPLKQVLLTIMEPLPDFLPADNLVEVTKIITSFWEELKKEKLAA